MDNVVVILPSANIYIDSSDGGYVTLGIFPWYGFMFMIVSQLLEILQD